MGNEYIGFMWIGFYTGIGLIASGLFSYAVFCISVGVVTRIDERLDLLRQSRNKGEVSD